jgi:hypothetical protein
MNICDVWMRIANALYECSECWQRIFHAHLYRKTEVLFSWGTRGGIFSLPWNLDQGLRRTAVRSAPTAFTTDSITSSGNRKRFWIDPPYSSVRLLDTDCRNWSNR